MEDQFVSLVELSREAMSEQSWCNRSDQQNNQELQNCPHHCGNSPEKDIEISSQCDQEKRAQHAY
eukprot:8649752-Ditylum_brightwellii.AAC.2